MIASLEGEAVGDAEGRNLFVSAMEYDLAGYHELSEIEAAKPKTAPKRIKSNETDKALHEMAGAALDLAERLASLDETAASSLIRVLEASDRFRRRYGRDYIDSLRRELERIGAVGRETAKQTKPLASPKPVVPEDARKFVLRAADAFLDCFEMEADARRGAPFVVALKAVVAGTGLNIPTDLGTVAEILDASR